MAKRLGIPYVTPYRNGGWRYRKLVPSDCREVLGRSNWTKAWPAGTDLELVVRGAKQLAAQHDAIIRRARGEAEEAELASVEATARRLHREAEDPGDIALAIDIFNSMGQTRLAEALAAGGKVPRKTMTISKAMEHDRKTHSADIDPRPGSYALRSFLEACGDLDVLQVTRGDVSAWIAAQREAGYAASTIRRRYSSLKAVVDRAMRDLGSERRSPFEHRIGGLSSPSDRVPFHSSHLRLINTYIDTSPRLQPDTRDLLKLMRDTGMGVAEAAGLEVADIDLTGPVPFAWLRPNSQRRLKTAARTRQVPLVHGALEAVTAALGRSQGAVGLFSGYNAGDRAADFVSAKLNKAIRRSGVPMSKRLSAYSFRHGVIEALRAAGVDEDLRRRIVGHTVGRDSHGRYGADRAELEAMRDALLKALPLLGQIESSVYRSHERE